jgi:hypothetical protein
MVNYILMEITALCIEDDGGGGDSENYDDAFGSSEQS